MKTVMVRSLTTGTHSVKGAWFPTHYTGTLDEAITFAEIKAAAVKGDAKIIVHNREGGIAVRKFLK